MPLLAVLPIVGGALVVVHYARREPGTAIFIAIAALISTLYAFACLGVLRPGAMLLFWGVAAAGIALAFVRPESALRMLQAPSVALFVGLSVLHAVLFADARYAFWDEFDQWGIVVREMLASHALYGLDSNAFRPSAPPGASLWHYFVCSNTHYSEGATYCSQFMLLLAPLLPLFDRTSWRRPGWVVATLALTFLVVAELTSGVASLYVDHLLGAFFAGTLVAYVGHDWTRRGLLLLAAPLFALALLKEPGAFFALGAAGFVGAHALGRDRGLLTPAAALAAVPLVAVASWQVRLHTQDARLHDPLRHDVWRTPIGLLPGAHEIAADPALVRRRFAEALLAQPMAHSAVSERFNEFSYPLMPDFIAHGRGLSALGWLCVALGAAALALASADRSRRRDVALLTGFGVAVLFVWSLALMQSYTTEFGTRGAELPSYVRYLNSALMPAVLLSAAAFLPLVAGSERARSRGLLLGALLVALYAVETPYVRPLHAPRPFYQFRQQTEPFTDAIARAVGPDAHVLVLFPVRDNGYHAWILRFQLAPVKSSVRAADFSHVADAPFWEQIGAHDYVWVFRSTPELERRMAAHVGNGSIQSSGVYAVHNGPGGVTLDPFMLPSRDS